MRPVPSWFWFFRRGGVQLVLFVGCLSLSYAFSHLLFLSSFFTNTWTHRCDRPLAIFSFFHQEVGHDAIIESVRTEGEVVALRESGFPFTLLAVDADQKIRYDRAIGRGSSTDKVSFEKFQEQEAVEMTSTDPTKQNLGRCMELADVRLVNDGTVEEFHAQIDAFLREDKKPSGSSNTGLMIAAAAVTVLVGIGIYFARKK